MRFLPILCIGCLLSLSDIASAQPPTRSQPVPTAEAASRMKVPEGFQVTLFAGEPDVVQPIAMTFDDRGRLWVVECLSYPKWSHDGTGRDRIVILEDTDGDGTHDKRTVFLDNGSNLSGIEIGYGGIWVCSLPNQLFIPDRDQNDVPDGPPEVLLDGWNLKETKHNVFNSLGWGPDGWLYGCNGIQAKSYVGKPGTPQDQRTFMDCGVWRFHPSRKKFEVVATGTTNPFGLDWNDYGQAFITNCVIDHLWHVVPGAHFQRMHGQDQNPFLYAHMGSASDHKHWAGGHWTESRSTGVGGKSQHSDAGGGHAHSGCAIYLGDMFPAEYRNSVFMCNIHGNRVNRDSLHRNAHGYVGKHERDFLHAGDDWFRGIATQVGPEGALYVTDWCDTGECHNYDVADTSNGRIYKVVYGRPTVWRGHVQKLSDAELIQAQASANEWLVRKARRILSERSLIGSLATTTIPQLQTAFSNARDTRQRLRLAWALDAVGGLRTPDVLSLLNAKESDHLRAWGVLLAVSLNESVAAIDEQIRRMCDADPSPFVRLHLASALPRLNPGMQRACLELLCQHVEDLGNTNLTLMYWYAIQPWVAREPAWASELIQKTPLPILRRFITKHLMDRPGESESTKIDTICKLIHQCQHDDHLRDVLLGFREALAGRRDIKAPPGWESAYEKCQEPTREREVRMIAAEIALLFNDRRALTALRARVPNQKADLQERIQAIRSLAGIKDSALPELLFSVLGEPPLREAAIRALAAVPSAKTPIELLSRYSTFSKAEQSEVIQTLTSRTDFAMSLLEHLELGKIAKSDINAYSARQVLALNNQRVTEKLKKVWGTIQTTDAAKQSQMAELKKLLTREKLKSASPDQGRIVYTRLCASCHKLFGEGSDIGPELTGSQRHNLDYLLENIVSPSSIVPYDAKMTAFNLTDGRTITGIIRKEANGVVTIRTVNEELIVPASDIERRVPTQLSVMPEGLLDQLKQDEIVNLFGYLMDQGSRTKP